MVEDDKQQQVEQEVEQIEDKQDEKQQQQQKSSLKQKTQQAKQNVQLGKRKLQRLSYKATRAIVKFFTAILTSWIFWLILFLILFLSTIFISIERMFGPNDIPQHCGMQGAPVFQTNWNIKDKYNAITTHFTLSGFSQTEASNLSTYVNSYSKGDKYFIKDKNGDVVKRVEKCDNDCIVKYINEGSKVGLFGLSGEDAKFLVDLAKENGTQWYDEDVQLSATSKLLHESNTKSNTIERLNKDITTEEQEDIEKQAAKNLIDWEMSEKPECKPYKNFFGKSFGSMLTPGQFNVPAEGRMTSCFGQRDLSLSGYDLSTHTGIDIAAPAGTPIYAAEDGQVSKVSYPYPGQTFGGSSDGSANYVIIEHSDGFATAYWHMKDISVTEGQTISRGDAIGTIGSTGFSTGAHLHFEVRKDGEQIDPWTSISGIQEPCKAYEGSYQFTGGAK